MFTRIDTVLLPVRDLDKAMATAHLGFTLRWKQANYAAINIAETPMTLYQPEGEFRPVSGHMTFTFYSTDIETDHRKLREAGAVPGEIDRFPDFAHFAFTDPDGNLMGVCWFPEK